MIQEFATQFSAGLSLLGSMRSVEDMLSGVLEPEEIEALIGEPLIKKREPPVWERLGGLADGVLAKYLSQEHPQTVAFVLNMIDSNAAATVIRDLPPEQHDDLLRRMLCARPVTDPVKDLVEETLKSELLGGGAVVVETTRHEHLAKILNGMTSDEVEKVLTNLEDVRPKAVKKLKELLFSFQDISELSHRARATVLERVPTGQLVLALHECDEEFCETVLSVLPARERRIAQNELKTLDSPSARDVRLARRAVAETALELAEQGVVVLNKKGNEEGEG